mgnify:CR=1
MKLLITLLMSLIAMPLFADGHGESVSS